MATAPEVTTVPADVAEMTLKDQPETTEKGLETQVSDAASAASSPPSSENTGPNFGKISWDICDRLRCESCGHAVSAPIKQCRSGHVLCLLCSNKVTTCPNKACEISLKGDLSVNTSLEKIANDAGVVLPCRSIHCDWRVPLRDLARHEKYCMLIRKGILSASIFPEKETEESKLDPDLIAKESIRQELNCSLCNHAAPAPIMQCRNGHVTCYYCLGRLEKFEDSSCPLCEGRDDAVVRNLHLEGMANVAEVCVPCRNKGCDVTEIAHKDLKEHLEVCEHQPIKCIHCNMKNSDQVEVSFENWDAMWEHYKEEHLQSFPAVSLDKLVVTSSKIKSVMSTEKGLGFFSWNHCLDPATGQAVPIFPGLLYHKPQDAFYFSVRIMGPLDSNQFYQLRVKPHDSAEAPLAVEACLPPTSYRVGYLDEASLATAAKLLQAGPCLVLSRPTLEHMLSVSSDGGLLFSVCPVKSESA